MDNVQKSYRRVGLLDEVRGLCILGVVVYHGIYVLVHVFGFTGLVSDHLSIILKIVQPLGAGAFIFVAGIVSRYSRSNLKRGLWLIGLGLVITLVTFIGENYLRLGNIQIRFGILSLLGSSMAIFGLLEKTPQIGGLPSKGVAPILGMVLAIIGFILTLQVASEHIISFLGVGVISLPDKLYSTSFLYPLGFYKPGEFHSTDYFPLLPWFFLYFGGTFLGVYFRDEKMPEFFYRSYLKPLSWVGKHSLLIYLLHQPVIMAVFTIIFRVILPKV